MFSYLGGEVPFGLELFEEGGEEEGGEEEDDGPEEDIGDVGAEGATSRALKHPPELLTVLQRDKHMHCNKYSCCTHCRRIRVQMRLCVIG